jgi:hypothetical protein
MTKIRTPQLSEKPTKNGSDTVTGYFRSHKQSAEVLDKDELSAAMRERVKLSIYMKRIMAIEDTGRRDWHEPLRRLRFNS